MRIARLKFCLGTVLGVFLISSTASAHSGGHGPVPKAAPLESGILAYLYSAEAIQASENGKPLDEKSSAGVMELVRLDGDRFKLRAHSNSPLNARQDFDLKVVALDGAGKMLAVLGVDKVSGNPWNFGIKTQPEPALLEVILADRTKAKAKWVAAFRLK